MGLPSCLNLGLVKLVDTVNLTQPSKSLDKDQVLAEYRDIFTGIGLFPGEVKIEVDPTIQPVIHPLRRVQHVISIKRKVELDRMEKVKEPTLRVNSLVIAEKPNGTLRICVDPRDPNKAIRPPHYPMVTLNGVLPQLSKAKYLTKLDARSGYWTLKLTEESSMLPPDSFQYP